MPAVPAGLLPSEQSCLRVVLADLRRRLDDRLAQLDNAGGG